jgi:hypothetical protein
MVFVVRLEWDYDGASVNNLGGRGVGAGQAY